MSTRVVLSFAMLLVAAGCGGDEGRQGGTSSTRCTVGEKKACACANGATGFKLCTETDHWSGCGCDAIPDDTAGGDDTVGGTDVVGGDDSWVSNDQACVRDCNGKQCGPDSCGGTCGTCPDGLSCGPTFQCTDGPCTPDCSGRECGDNGCGGSCGSCSDAQACDQDGQCTSSCVPDCEGKVCGPDGCNSSCGSCSSGQSCNANGQCVSSCTPQCSGKQCGPDGCNGSCGTCTGGKTCNAYGQCVTSCTPQCSGKVCGDNGCGGSCGSCASGTACQSGQCVASSEISCQQLYLDCFPACPDGDQTCIDTCYSTLSATGKAETDPFMDCMTTNCANAADVNTCIIQNCWSQYLGCFHGDKSCAQVVSCIDACGVSDANCWSNCMDDGTTQAQADLYGRADQCLIDLCCPSDTALCDQTAGQTCIDNALAVGGACQWPNITCP